MNHIYALITLDFQNEHDLEHDLEHKKQFSTPKIFDADGDLKKRWYVYFSYRNPKTGKLQRMQNIYGKTNRFKTKAERYSALNLYKKRLLRLLKEGYNPFEDNSELHLERKQKQKAKVASETKKEKNSVSQTKAEPQKEAEASKTQKPKPKKKTKGLSIKKAFEKAIELKQNTVADKTLEDYQSRIKKLLQWLRKHKKSIKTIDQLDKKIIVEFLNEMQLKSSPRNRNNYRTIFSTIFQVLEDNDIIENNFIKQIKPLRTKPTRHKTYTTKQQKEIFKYLEENDPHLLLFIKFVGYNFLRPIEVCRLKVKDINMSEKMLSFKAKNKALKTKIIPQILMDELPDLSKLNKEDLLFTKDSIGGQWDKNKTKEASLINRRDHFSKRFGSIKKKLGFSTDYSLYSFRHTFITKVYRELAKDYSPHETKSILMQITGHSTMTALDKYLRDIDAALPKDYSDLLKN